MKQKRFAFNLILALTLLGVVRSTFAYGALGGRAFAQGDFGTISGFVYRDLNTDGTCTEANEPGVSGIPIQAINLDDNTTVNLTTESNGSYSLQDALAGTWQVTVNPGPNWRVTSAQTVDVDLEGDDLNVISVDFCIVEVATSTPPPQATSVPPTPVGGQTVLPESGAPLSPGLMTAVGLGLLLLLAGGIMLLRSTSRP